MKQGRQLLLREWQWQWEWERWPQQLSLQPCHLPPYSSSQFLQQRHWPYPWSPKPSLLINLSLQPPFSPLHLQMPWHQQLAFQRHPEQPWPWHPKLAQQHLERPQRNLNQPLPLPWQRQSLPCQQPSSERPSCHLQLQLQQHPQPSFQLPQPGP